MIARLLTILALALPVAACATQPAAAQDGRADGARAAVNPAPPAPASVPALAPAPAAQAATPTESQQLATAPAVGVSGSRGAAPATVPAPAARPNGRAVASSGTPSAAAPATAPAGQDAAAAPLGSTPIQETPAGGTLAATTPGAVSGVAAAGTGAPPAAGAATMPAATPTGSLLQTLFALVAVLAVLAALAWFLKRYGPRAGGGGANLRIVGSLNLGGRERLLVVEVGNQWIVVGASPGRVNALATMPRQEGADAGAGGATLAHGSNAAPSANSFADWLKQTIDKRK